MSDGIFRALADPTRRQILRLLRQGDRYAGDIASEFPISWAATSRHLGILRDAELVLTVREGQFIRYSLNTTVFQDVLQELIDLLPEGHEHNGRDDA